MPSGVWMSCFWKDWYRGCYWFLFSRRHPDFIGVPSLSTAVSLWGSSAYPQLQGKPRLVCESANPLCLGWVQEWVWPDFGQ